MRYLGGLACAALAVGCTAIIGTRDLTYEPSAASDAGVDGNVPVSPTSDASACGDTTSNAKNCGRCGHDCLGGTCTQSKCDAVTLGTALQTPTGIALDDTNVYLTLTLANAVVKIPKAGGKQEQVAPAHLPFGLVLVDGTLFVAQRDFQTDMGGLYKCTLAACTLSLVVKGDYAQNVHFGGGYLVWVDNQGFDIRWQKPDGTDAHQVTTNSRPYGNATDGATLYYNTIGVDLEKLPITGGTPTKFASFGVGYMQRGDVEVDGDWVYYTYVDSGGVPQVAGIPKDPNDTERRSYGPTQAAYAPLSMAFDATYIYWTAGTVDTDGNPTGAGGELRACHKTGCIAGEPLVLTTALPSSGEIALDDKAIYIAATGSFTGTAGALVKIAKP